MKKLLIAFLAILSLSSIAGATQFGIRGGILLAPNGGVVPQFGVQYVANDVLGPYTDIRAIASIGFFGGGLVIQLQPSLMFRFPLDQAGNLYAYAGPGAVVLINLAGGVLFGPLGRGGIEFQFTPTLSVFGDAGLGVLFGSNTVVFFDFAVGLNLRLIESAG